MLLFFMKRRQEREWARPLPAAFRKCYKNKRNMVCFVGKESIISTQFQNEERYVLRFLPVDAKRMIDCENAKEVVYQAFINTNNNFLPYYDLKIRDDAFNSMEITLSPQFTDGNKILLETLCQKYNPDMKIVESALKNKVRL